MEDLIKALQILLKYKDVDNPPNCIHDELIIMEIHQDEVSKEDIKRLDELGFYWDEEEEYFYSNIT